MSDYILLVSTSTGLHLSHDGSGFQLRARCDDNAVWGWAGRSQLKNAVTGKIVDVEPCSAVLDVREAEAIVAAFGPGASALVPKIWRLTGSADVPQDQLEFAARPAPARLPSAYLAELQAQGWTVVENLMSPEMVANLVANVDIVRNNAADKEARVRAAQDTRPYQSNDNVIRPRSLMEKGESFLSMTPVVAQALMHPISLWLIEKYLGVDSIHYCQCPGISILRPAEKTGELNRVEPGGWHADYPYPLTSETEAHTFRLGGDEFEKLDASISARHPDWKQRKDRLGMQFNIALTDFTPETGATQFVLGSHKFHTPPTTEMNAVPTVAGQGPHKDVAQVSFPAGSGILYDSRTWHRAPPELNVSGAERWAMLTCIVPSFVRDLRARDDKVESADSFAEATRVHAALTLRELDDVVRMLCDDESGQPRADIEAAVARGIG
ncbi:MAG: hypothetical protein CMQ29_12630 [Gammaproteobacteria bacterium]|nr:hypothetical protein [Gammaproteobacteria bacterium]